MKDYEDYDYNEDYTEDIREEREERKRSYEAPAWTEGYLSTLGMSMRDFL